MLIAVPHQLHDVYHFREERSRQIMSLVMMDCVGFFGCYQNLYISVVPFSGQAGSCLALMFLSSLLDVVLFVYIQTHHSNLK